MKNLVLTVLAVIAFSANTMNAQSSYSTAVGLGIDFGDGSTFVGPSAKFFLAEEHALEADILFADGSTLIQGFYEYHGPITGADGLKWYAGIGPGFNLFDGGSNFLLRPIVGLDFKINDVPLAFSFDWRPAMIFFDGDSDFEAARFGLGFRYAFN
ncbi:hypothetical protein [Costertonia aggregata]|uniref:Outer membrane insertion C-signal n=1 Tax=Costertonia aggregata TaxID=343403 RepID=A0A7H9ASM6_9FLAO|nr:hypothetical protein [Costertonia aggregata]QLG46436.1 hypothetical protein HYG79_14125 [Costertonia aggregata]